VIARYLDYRRVSSFLTLRTVVTTPAGNNDPLNGRLANQAGLAFPSIDTMLELKETFIAVGVNVIRNTRAPQSNCLL